MTLEEIEKLDFKCPMCNYDWTRDHSCAAEKALLLHQKLTAVSKAAKSLMSHASHVCCDEAIKLKKALEDLEKE